MAALVTLFCVIIFWQKKSHTFTIKITVFQKREKLLLLAVGIGLSIILSTFLVKNTLITNIAFFSLSIFFVIYALKRSFDFSKKQRNQLLVCLLLTLLSVIFWLLYQQGAMSLNIYTEYNVQRHFIYWTIPTVVFQSCNPLFVILCGPLIGKLWTLLDRKGINPSTPAKFAVGIILMGTAFILFPLPILMKSSAGQINLWWIVLSYFVQSIGELFLSPVGLSMITELSPKQVAGLMMGVWYFATALANALAGFASTLTTLPSNQNDPLTTSSIYSHAFGELGLTAIIIGILTLALAPKLNKIIANKI